MVVILEFKKAKLEPELSDEYLVYLAENFLSKDYYRRYRVTFEEYVKMKIEGAWETFKELN